MVHELLRNHPGRLGHPGGGVGLVGQVEHADLAWIR
jgi:hypothetical protein